MHPATRVALQSVPAAIAGARLALPALSKIASGLITVTERLASIRRFVASQSVKKKSLFFMIGPPTAPPYWFRINLGLRKPAGLNLLSALSALSVWNSKALP